MIVLILFIQLVVPRHIGLRLRLNVSDPVPVQGGFQRSLSCLLLRLIELITLMILEMVLLFLFLRLMKVQYTVISDLDPRLVANP